MSREDEIFNAANRYAGILKPRQGYPVTPLGNEAPIISHGDVGKYSNGSAKRDSSWKRAFSEPSVPMPISRDRSPGKSHTREDMLALPECYSHGRSVSSLPGMADSSHLSSNRSLHDFFKEVPHASFVPPPLPIVGNLARRLGNSVCLEEPSPGKLVGLAPGMTTCDGLDGLIKEGSLDRCYMIQEAARRKSDIDRTLRMQLAELDSECEHRSVAIRQQAEYHTRLVEKQIENQKRDQIAFITQEATQQACVVSQRAQSEKEHILMQAKYAIAQAVERQKGEVFRGSFQATDALHSCSQRAWAEQAGNIREQIKDETKRNILEIDNDARRALSSFYVQPPAYKPPALGVPLVQSSVRVA